jgi:hypothetical protein
VEGKGIGRLKLRSPTAREVMLNLRRDFEDGWDQSELTFIMRWSEHMVRPALLDRIFFYAPEELPVIGARATSVATSVQRVPVSVDESNDRQTIGAISSKLDGKFHPEGPHLQAVLCTALELHPSAYADESLEICVVGEGRITETRNTLASICSQLREMVTYFGERLNAKPGLRLGLALDSQEGARSMFGALLTVPKTWYRSLDKHHQGKEFQVARMIANIWWGAGCRVGGERGIHLASGIAFGLGLAWARDSTSEAYFDRQTTYFREHLVTEVSSRSSKLGAGERTVPIGIAILDGLIAHDSVWECLARITREYWGLEAPEEVLVGMLESAGVNVEDFERKRFLL